MQQIIQAVSVVLSRGPNSREVFLVKRAPQLSFLGGYFAFPAGTLEDEDRQVAQLYLSPHPDLCLLGISLIERKGPQ